MTIAGRKPVLNEKLIGEICTATENLVFNKTIIQAIGVSECAFYDWQRKGKKVQGKLLQDEPISERDELYLDYYERLKKAEAKARIKAVDIIREAGFYDWRAIAWLLERRDPENYHLKRRKRMNHGNYSQVIKIN